MIPTATKAATAVILLMTAVACAKPASEANNEAGPIFSLEDSCGLKHDIFYVMLYADRINPFDEPRFDVQTDEFIELVEAKTQEVEALIQESFEKSDKREERFENEAEKFSTQIHSEDCIYVKLRIYEHLMSAE